jgi:hypothetical protein
MRIRRLSHGDPPIVSIVSIVNAGAAEMPSFECVAERTVQDACARF